MLNLDDNRLALAIPPLLRLAFRPLFLGGTLFSVFAIAWWTYFWLNPGDWNPYGGVMWWHGHEMLFGFGSAIIVGFLLTAVATWTGVTGLRGRLLGLLAACWLGGRLLVSVGASLPPGVVMAVDLSFLVFAAMAMAYPVLKVKQWRNAMFAPMLLVLAILNGLSHWGVLSGQPELAMRALHGAIMLIALIISVVGGRVMPFFTANASAYVRRPPVPWLEWLGAGTLILLVAFAIVGFSRVPASITTALCLGAALVNGWRFMRWGIQYSWGVPLLWSLHLSYVFIPLGLLALALYSMGFLASMSIALHCFTAGAMGGMILAMISRVTLGHTGRQLKPPPAIVPAFSFILLGASVRVAVPALWPEYSQLGVGFAGAMWVLAYGTFCVCYGPMLMAARVDGQPG